MRAATQRVQRRPPTARQRQDFYMRTAGPAVTPAPLHYGNVGATTWIPGRVWRSVNITKSE
ncbi:hypothetical protein J6590_038714 [Homalodisca vitripennis]|nr:hypothetical protein J6590_038714 [Homalodisca vitripennis]